MYYFGARYYDPRTSAWQSADLILEKYLPTGNDEHDMNLLGMGGVFNSKNMSMYIYTHNNPVIFTDPDGNAAGLINKAWEIVKGGVTVGPVDAWQTAKGKHAQFGVSTSNDFVSRYPPRCPRSSLGT